MDEVFGEAGFVAQVVVNLNAKGRQLGQGLRDQPRVPPRLRDATPPRASSTPAARTPSTSATSRWPTPTAAATGTCRCATPTRSSTRSPRAPCTSRSGATPRPAGWRRRRSTVRSRSRRCSATAGRRCGGGAGRGSTSAPTTWSAAGSRAARRAGRRVPEGLAARRPPQEAAHHLAGRGDRLHRHRGRRAQGDRRPRLRVAEADRADPADPRDHARRRGGARLLRRQRYDGARGRAAERRGRRHPPLPEHQLRRADPRRAPTRSSPGWTPSPTSPGPGCAPSPRRSVAGSTWCRE